MNNNNGFITILSLLVMAILLISAMFLAYTYTLEYQISNANRNNTQSFYSAESKIYLTLNDDKYYENQLLPRIERYIKLNRLGPKFDYKIRLDKDELLLDDTNNIVNIDFIGEYENEKFMLTAQTSHMGIRNKVNAEVSIYNDLFTMGIPVLTYNTISEDQYGEFDNYFSYLSNHIEIPLLEEEMTNVLAKDYEEIKIIEDADNKIYAEFYRGNQNNLIYKNILNSNKVFLLLKNNKLHPTMSIISENDGKIKLEGIIYVEGDLYICNDFEFKGILIVNGSIFTNPLININIDGVVLYNGSSQELEEHEGIIINYDFNNIKKYGLYLPKFIDLKINKVKVI